MCSSSFSDLILAARLLLGRQDVLTRCRRTFNGLQVSRDKNNTSRMETSTERKLLRVAIHHSKDKGNLHNISFKRCHCKVEKVKYPWERLLTKTATSLTNVNLCAHTLARIISNALQTDRFLLQLIHLMDLGRTLLKSTDKSWTEM